MKTLLQVVVFHLFGLFSISAQSTFDLKGQVVDFHNNTELQNAKISIGSFYAVTNEDGLFTINNLPKGTYILKASHEECEDYSQELTINSDVDIRIALEHHYKEIEAVTIHGKPVHSKVSSITILGNEFIENNATDNLGNTLSKISGVSVLKTGNTIAKPIIRGLYGSRILLFNNNVRMAEQEWGVEHAPSVDTNAFDHIEVIKGAQTLKYGSDAIGGVVVMKPKLFPRKDSIQGKVMASGISNGKGIHINASLAKIGANQWYIKGQGAYKKIGDYNTPDFSLNNTAMTEKSFSIHGGKRSFREGIEFYYSGIIQNIGIFRGSHIGFSDEFFEVLNNHKTLYTDDFDYSIEAPRQEVNHHLAKFSIYKRFDRIGKFTLDYNFQFNNRKEFDIRRKKYSDLPSMNMELTTHEAKFSHLLERKKWTVDSGVQLRYQNNYPNPDTGVKRLIPDYKKYDAGIYSILNYKWNNKLHSEFGLRYDFHYLDAYKYYSKTDWETRFATQFPQFFEEEVNSKVLVHPEFYFHTISYNAGLKYRPSKNTLAEINLSKSTRSPNPAELFADGLHHSASIIEKGSLSIKQESTYQVSLALEQKINFLDGWQIGVHPYYLYSEDFIQQIPTDISNTIRGIFPVWEYQQVEASMYGAEIDSQLKIDKNITFTSSYSKVVGDNISHNEPLYLIAPATMNHQLRFNFLANRNAFLSIENATAFTQNRFVKRDLAITLIENNQFIETTLDLSTPPKGYSIFNISTGIDWTKNFSLTMNIHNLFNKNYRTYLNRLRYYSDEIGRNFILTLKYKF